MYSFRYNPVFKRWVLCGSPVVPFEEIGRGHIINQEKKGSFKVATLPRDVLKLEVPTDQTFQKEHHDQLRLTHPALGEYELLLYEGEKDFWSWDEHIWHRWLEITQSRFRMLHANLDVTQLYFELRTDWLYSLKAYLRVGDLIGSAHPIIDAPEITEFEQEKLQKEEMYMVYRGEYGWLHVPMAPLANQELWYLPLEAKGGIEHLGQKASVELCRVLAKVVKKLHEEWPDAHWSIKIYSQVGANEKDYGWWLRINSLESAAQGVALPISNNPEGFVFVLHHILGNI